MSKKIEIIRGGSDDPITVSDLDVYDSLLKVSDPIQGLIYVSNHWNTLPSRQIFGKDYLKIGGILVPGTYGAICQTTNGVLRKCLKLFKMDDWDKVNLMDDITAEMATFISLKPNANHEGQLIVSEVCIHDGLLSGSGSEGCQTGYPPDYPGFIGLFAEKEKVTVELTVADGFKYPAETGL